MCLHGTKVRKQQTFAGSEANGAISLERFVKTQWWEKGIRFIHPSILGYRVLIENLMAKCLRITDKGFQLVCHETVDGWVKEKHIALRNAVLSPYREHLKLCQCSDACPIARQFEKSHQLAFFVSHLLSHHPLHTDYKHQVVAGKATTAIEVPDVKMLMSAFETNPEKANNSEKEAMKFLHVYALPSQADNRLKPIYTLTSEEDIQLKQEHQINISLFSKLGEKWHLQMAMASLLMEKASDLKKHA